MTDRLRAAAGNLPWEPIANCRSLALVDPEGAVQAADGYDIPQERAAGFFGIAVGCAERRDAPGTRDAVDRFADEQTERVKDLVDQGLSTRVDRDRAVSNEEVKEVAENLGGLVGSSPPELTVMLRGWQWGQQYSPQAIQFAAGRETAEERTAAYVGAALGYAERAARMRVMGAGPWSQRHILNALDRLLDRLTDEQKQRAGTLPAQIFGEYWPDR